MKTQDTLDVAVLNNTLQRLCRYHLRNYHLKMNQVRKVKTNDVAWIIDMQQ